MTSPRSDFLNILTERGYLHQCSDFAGLDGLAGNGKVTAYVGYDCTAPSLHVGSLISIMMLHHLQQTGNTPIVLMGGGTTRVGDPSGRDETRKILTVETIEDNKNGIKRVFSNFLEFGSGAGKATMVDNADWLTKLNYIEFLRDVGRHFSINNMLTFDSVKMRLEREQPLSFIEFNYMILQAYDFVELSRRFGLQPADGRLRPVGQHRQRHRPWPADGHRAALRVDLPAADDVIWRQDGEDRFRRHLAERRAAFPL